MITVDQVAKRIDEIRALTHDPEAAHGRIDALHIDVLKAIADGSPTPHTLAALALQTEAVDVARWCA